MNRVVALFAAVILALSSVSSHASGMVAVGDSEIAHHSAVDLLAHDTDAVSAESSNSDQSGHEIGCAAGHCAAPCGFLPVAVIEPNHETFVESVWMVSKAQTSGLDLSFDPPPPRA